MRRPLHLGLRDGRHMVSVVKLEDRPGEVLGVAYPEDGDRRARIPEQWGSDARSPRHADPATINEALPQRSQTILSYQVDAALRRTLNGGLAAPPASRKDLDAGEKARAHLGHGQTPMDTHARGPRSPGEPDAGGPATRTRPRGPRR